MSFKIKDYIIDRKRIGKGSFSSIYKCYNAKTNKKYAIKEIIIDKNHNKSVIKREFNVLKTLNHPNIIKLHDVIIDTSFQNIYFIMDYHEYGDLSKFLNKRALKEKYCKKYLRQLSEALNYLFQNNIVHRDLKPQNILMSNSHNIIITDFGFARKINEKLLFTTLCGSPMYMAPEIFNKQAYNNKSDLWSVGIIMYEMLHGYVPFKVSNFIELINKINNEKIYINKDLNLSLNCLNLLSQLIQVDPNTRIEWEDFFNHRWFENDDILNNENNLLEININKLPTLNDYKVNENVFASHNNTMMYSNELNFNLLFKTDESFEENSDIYLSANSTLNSIELSVEDNKNYINNDLIKIQHNNSKSLQHNNNSLQYNKHYNQSFNSKISDYEILNNKSDDFILINPSNKNSNSLPSKNKTITSSFKDYLYSSFNILKQSYKYINTKSI